MCISCIVFLRFRLIVFMKLLKVFFIVLVIFSLVGLGYVASIDVPVQQILLTKTIPNDAIFHDP